MKKISLTVLFVFLISGCTTSPREFNQRTEAKDTRRVVLNMNYQEAYRNIRQGLDNCSLDSFSAFLGGREIAKSELYHDIKKGHFNLSLSGSLGLSGPGIIHATVNIEATSDKETLLIVRGKNAEARAKTFTNLANKDHPCAQQS